MFDWPESPSVRLTSLIETLGSVGCPWGGTKRRNTPLTSALPFTSSATLYVVPSVTCNVTRLPGPWGAGPQLEASSLLVTGVSPASVEPVYTARVVSGGA